MKRFVTWTLALTLALPLVACGGKKAETKSETVATSETVAASETSGEAEKPFTIQPFQAVDKQDYGIRVDGYMMDPNDNGFISFRLQNKSETVSYRFLFGFLHRRRHPPLRPYQSGRGAGAGGSGTAPGPGEPEL